MSQDTAHRAVEAGTPNHGRAVPAGPRHGGRRQAELPGQPADSTVRTQLRVLEGKGHVRHEELGLRYVYMPVVRRDAARRLALRHLAQTFFDGSAQQIVAAILGGEAARLTDDDLSQIAELVDQARKGAAK